MKAYKYGRYVQGWHWSTSIGETLVYIPGADFIIYKSGDKFGINKKEIFINEAKEYISDVQSSKVEKDYVGSFVNKDRKFVKEVAEYKEKHVTHSPCALYDFEEVELNITEEGIKELLNENDIFSKEKETFEKTEKIFHNNLKNLILEK
jgi:pterin-4a-carbinolamine dehydratase